MTPADLTLDTRTPGQFRILLHQAGRQVALKAAWLLCPNDEVYPAVRAAVDAAPCRSSIEGLYWIALEDAECAIEAARRAVGETP